MKLPWLNFLLVFLLWLALNRSLPAQESSSKEPEAISVCELFQDLRSHAGKLISVRGLLFSGTEIFALGGRCESKFITHNAILPPRPGFPATELEFTWPTALDLAVSALAQPGETPVEFRTDDTVDRVYTKIKTEKAKFGSRETDVWVTVVGKLRLKQHYDIGRTADGVLRGEGYGHLGAYPGQLVIKTMLDPVIELHRE